MLLSAEPILPVTDVAATVDYYERVLGFSQGWTWGDGPDHGGARRDSISLQFNRNSELAERCVGLSYALFVDDANAIYAEHLAQGAAIVSPIDNKPWGVREYTVRDMNGYLIRFGGPCFDKKHSGLRPSELIVEFRVPTSREFIAVHSDYPEDDIDRTLGETHAGAVATLHSTTIGVARVMRDRPGWYSVWDVEVVPEWQGMQVGRALMDAILAGVKAECPQGGIIHLFTMKHGFYAKLGYITSTVTLQRF